jgi:hypothetical protein
MPLTKFLRETYKSSKFIKFPNEAGIDPDSWFPKRSLEDYFNGTLHSFQIWQVSNRCWDGAI